MRRYARERLDRITVKGLCAAVPVARTTFYAHYRNVDDVLREVEDDLLEGLVGVAERVSGGDLASMDFSTLLDETFSFVQGRWSDIHTLLVVQPDARFVARWRSAMKVNFSRRYPQALLQPSWDLLAEMAASAAIGAYVWWMENPDGVNREDAKRLVERSLSAVMASLGCHEG